MTTTERTWWMKFEPQLWLSSPRVRMLTFAERGMYMDLLCYAWQSSTVSLPSLPADPEALARLLGEQPTGAVLAMFEEKNSRLYNDKLSTAFREAEKLHKAGKKGGQASAAARKNKKNQRVNEILTVERPLNDRNNDLPSSNSTVQNSTEQEHPAAAAGILPTQKSGLFEVPEETNFQGQKDQTDRSPRLARTLSPEAKRLAELATKAFDWTPNEQSADCLQQIIDNTPQGAAFVERVLNFHIDEHDGFWLSRLPKPTTLVSKWPELVRQYKQHRNEDGTPRVQKNAKIDLPNRKSNRPLSEVGPKFEI